MADTYKILLVDDNDDFRLSLKEQLLLQREFEVSDVDTGKGGLEATDKQRFDMILLDVDLPDLDGREICKIMRNNNVKTPIIMLTAQSSDADTILGLDSGANDYVTKPIRIGVLLARIRAQLRLHEHSEDAEFNIGPYKFMPARKMLKQDNGDIIRLTEKEMLILKFLYRAKPKAVSKEVLLGEVWGYSDQVTTHTLETHIYRLRQKIEPGDDGPQLIITDIGGYKLGV